MLDGQLAVRTSSDAVSDSSCSSGAVQPVTMVSGRRRRRGSLFMILTRRASNVGASKRSAETADLRVGECHLDFPREAPRVFPQREPRGVEGRSARVYGASRVG